MIDEKREALSAMLDDELPGRVFDQLVTDLGHDADLRESMSRYRLIGDVLRGESVVAGPGDVAAAVRERLSDEPAILAPRRARTVANWGRGLAGLAIAASVALVAVGMLSEQQIAPREADKPAQLVAVTPPQQQVKLARRAANQNRPQAVASASSDGDANERLARYLAAHNEFASRGGASGFMSYTTFVAYDGR